MKTKIKGAQNKGVQNH